MNEVCCKKCDWSGKQDQLGSDLVDTCSGPDRVDMCPSCGSYEIVENQEVDNTSRAR